MEQQEIPEEQRQAYDIAQFERLVAEQHLDMGARNNLHGNVFGIMTGIFSMVIGAIALMGFISQFKFAPIGETLLLGLASIILFVGVIILFFLASYYADLNLAIGKIATVLGDVEKNKKMSILWDTIRNERFGVMPLHDLISKKRRANYNHLASIKGLKDISIRGFVTLIQSVLFYLGAISLLFSWLIAGYWIVLVLVVPVGLVAGTLIWLTWMIAEHRRVVKTSDPEKEKENA